jgi:hypothetical protein
MPTRVRLEQWKGPGRSITVLPTGENLPPTDGRWVHAILKTGLEIVVPIQFDAKWGKSGGWFDERNRAISHASIVRWFSDDPEIVAVKPPPPQDRSAAPQDDYRGGDYDYGEYDAFLRSLAAQQP